MQNEVFQTPHDHRLDAMGERFNPWINFSREDVSPIQKPLPLLIQKWASDRDFENKKPASCESGAEVVRK